MENHEAQAIADQFKKVETAKTLLEIEIKKMWEILGKLSNIEGETLFVPGLGIVSQNFLNDPSYKEWALKNKIKSIKFIHKFYNCKSLMDAKNIHESAFPESIFKG